MQVRVPLAFALLPFAVVFSPPCGYAMKPSPLPSWTKDSPCGKYRFVMRGLFGKDDTPNIYPESGLHHVEGFPILIWAAPWYRPKGEVAQLSDGKHVVLSESSGESVTDRAVHFFVDGRHLRSYHGEELVDHRIWVHQPGAGLNANAGLYWLTTPDGNSFRFSLDTGEIVWQSRPGRTVRGVLAGFGRTTGNREMG